MSALDQDCDLVAGELDEDDERGWTDAHTLEPAFEAFYREHYAFVWRSARRMLAAAGDDAVEDLIQDTWLAVYRRFDSFDGACLPTSWLFGILRNVARNHNRGEQRRTRRIAALAAHERDRAQVREQGEATRQLARSMLQEFLSTLDPDKRAVFVLSELEGQTGREIAAALDINPNTAQSRLRAARRQFCAYFDLPHSRDRVAGRVRSLRERPEQPPADARARSWGLLVAGLAPSTALETSAGASMLALLGKGLLAKLAVVVGLVAAVGVGLHESRGRDEPRERSPASASKPPVRGSRVDVVIAEAESEAAPDAEVEPIVVVAPAVAPAAEQRPDVYELVRQARSALVHERPEQALALLERAPASDATLRAQRVATEIAALCRLERGDEARAVAEAFASIEPDSPLLTRIDSACW